MTSLRFCPRVTALAPSLTVDAALAALGARPGFVALDGVGAAGEAWTILGFDPLAQAPLPRRASGLGAFAAQLELHPSDEAGASVPGPFHGGFLGALAYDLGPEGERMALPADPWGTPPIAGGLYVDFVVFQARDAFLVLGDAPGDGRPPLEARRAELLHALAQPPAPPSFEALAPLERRVPPAEHRRRIEVLREWIAAGELYQANLAHPFVGRTRGRPVDLLRLLRRTSPAPHGGMLVWDEPRGALISASPELLLEVDGEHAFTRPIKGTARRSADAAEDAALARALLASEKDRAELAMIVDLERNDLGRVARAGGVHVDAFPVLRSFSGVHHLTADVHARLAPGKSAADVLAALFPGGSITGAPKLRAMQAIAELEGEGRGFFTGSLGFLDTRGRASFDVLIRTFQWRPSPDESDVGEIRLHVGGGITWSSRAEDEDEETLVKAARLLAALEQEALRAP